MSALSKDPASGLEYIAVGETENPKRILIVLHGTGDNCNGIKPVGDAFAGALADTLVLIPNGPVSLAEILPPEQIAAAKQANPAFDAEAARNWSGASTTPVTDDESYMQSVEEVMAGPVAALNTLIDIQLKKHGLDDKNLAVYGFSAGGLMALHTTIARDAACAGVVSHSGHFLGADAAVSKPKTLMIFGDQELAHPQLNELFTASVEWLRDLGLPVEQHTCKDLAHGINQEAFDAAAGFIKKSLKEAAPAATVKPARPKPPQP